MDLGSYSRGDGIPVGYTGTGIASDSRDVGRFQNQPMQGDPNPAAYQVVDVRGLATLAGGRLTQASGAGYVAPPAAPASGGPAFAELLLLGALAWLAVEG